MSGLKSVYVMGAAKPGPRKIGISQNAHGRLGQLQVGPDKLDLIAHYKRDTDDALMIERVAHRLLAKKWIRGEWFEVTDAEAIAAVKEAICLVERGDVSILQRVKHVRTDPNAMPRHITIIPLPDELRMRVNAFQFAETARSQRKISQAEVIRRALELGMDQLEREGHLDVT